MLVLGIGYHLEDFLKRFPVRLRFPVRDFSCLKPGTQADHTSDWVISVIFELLVPHLVDRVVFGHCTIPVVFIIHFGSFEIQRRSRSA